MLSSNQFKVLIQGCSNLFQITTPEGNPVSEQSLNGREIITLISAVKQENNASTRIWGGSVETRDVPRDDGSQINVLWLAFGSACYFDSITNGLFRPIWTQDDRSLTETNFLVKGMVERKKPGTLPEKVFYFNDGIQRNERNGQYGDSISYPSPAPLDQGFTNVVYTAGQMTNVLGIDIPTDFVFERSGPRSSNGMWSASTLTRTEGKVERIFSNPDATLIPNFPASIAIQDLRFKGESRPVKALIYSITNGEWLTKDRAHRHYETELKQKDYFAKLKEKPPRPKVPKNPGSEIMDPARPLVIGTVCLCLAFALALRKRYRRK